ncbi:MAG: hypothetical protein RQ757_06540 [Pseudomonadales bacterium]|nr:hypothetical protein [Pseudomonadales bacterium]
MEKRPFILAGIMTALFILDPLSTRYLVVALPSGQELNPYVDTSSFLRLLFNYAHVIPYIVFLLCLYLAEKMAWQYNELIRQKSVRLMAFVFPLFFISTKALAVINNTFLVFGVNSPVLMLLRWMTFLSDDLWQNLSYLHLFMAIALGPVYFKLARMFYGRDSAP